MAGREFGVDIVAVVGAVAGDGRHCPLDPLEQGTDLGAIVGILVGQHRGDDPAGVGVRREMQHSPGPAPLGAVLLDQPLARAAELQPRAVHQQVHRRPPRLWTRHRQRLGPAAEGGVVRHREIETEQLQDGADQPLGLAQRQAEHGSQRQRRRDRQIGVEGYPPRAVRGSALQAAIASGVNHTVKLPRARKPASYSAQLVTRCRCFGMWWRQAALALNGTAGVQASGKGPSSYTAQFLQICGSGPLDLGAGTKKAANFVAARFKGRKNYSQKSGNLWGKIG